MDVVYVVMKNKRELYKVCVDEESAKNYAEGMNDLDSDNRYGYHAEMVRSMPTRPKKEKGSDSNDE